MYRLLIHVLIFLYVSHVQALGATVGPLFVYEGILTDSAGEPLSTAQTVSFRVLYAGTCVVYEETQTVIPGSQGEFSVTVGAGTRTDLTANDALRIFASSGSVECSGASSRTVSGSGNRTLHIRVGSTDLLPDVEINSVPFAINAQRLEDKRASDFAQLNANVTQANLDSTYYRFSALDKALNIFAASPSSGQVLMGTGSGFAMGVLAAGSGVSIAPGTGSLTIELQDSGVTPGVYGSASAIPLLTVNNKGQITAVSTAALAGVAPSGAASGDLSGAYPNPTLASDSVTSAKIRDGEVGNADISAAAAIEDSKLATISSAGKVANSATTGTSSATGNTLVLRDSAGDFAGNSITANTVSVNQLNSTQAYATDLYLRNANNNTVKFSLNPAAATNFSVVWPDNAGSAGKILSNDGNGNLTWMSPSAGGLVGIVANSPLSASGGSSATLSISQAHSAGDGYLSSSDWNTFNNKMNSGAIFSGDVSGQFSNISVDKIKGKQIVSGVYQANQFLRYDGASWVNEAIRASTDITGILPVANGGTGSNSLPSGSLLVGGGTGAVTGLAAGFAGNILYASGVGAWGSASPDFAGLVDKTTTQTIGGAKAFTNYVQLSSQNQLRLADLDSSNYVALRAPATVNSNVTLTLPADSGVNAQVLSTDGGGVLSWVSGFLNGGNSFGTAASLGTNDNFPLNFKTNGSPRMIVDGAGNVGIGTVSPTSTLEVVGVVKANGFEAQTCPAGMTLVSMGRESFCISTVDQTMKTWYTSIESCITANTSLCTGSQYIAACRKGVISTAANRWTDGRYSPTNVFVVSCSWALTPAFVNADENSTVTYRCCSR